MASVVSRLVVRVRVGVVTSVVEVSVGEVVVVGVVVVSCVGGDVLPSSVVHVVVNRVAVGVVVVNETVTGTGTDVVLTPPERQSKKKVDQKNACGVRLKVYSPWMTVLEVMRVDEAHCPVSVPEADAEARHEVMTVVLVVSGRVVTLEENEVETEVDVMVPNSVRVADVWQDMVVPDVQLTSLSNRKNKSRVKQSRHEVGARERNEADKGARPALVKRPSIQ